MYDDILYLCVAFAGSALLVVSPIVISYFIAPRKTRQYLNKTGQVIECGMDPFGDSAIRFGVVYYLYGLIFIAFSVDVLYLLPVAAVYNTEFKWRDLGEIAIFIGLLVLVLVYAWKKGVFTWKNKIQSRKA